MSIGKNMKYRRMALRSQTQKPVIKMVFLSSYGGVAVCDERGEQIPELQENLLSAWAKDAERKGYDPSTCIIEATNMSKLRFFKTSEGRWNIREA
jgi:hypothetical protein